MESDMAEAEAGTSGDIGQAGASDVGGLERKLAEAVLSDTCGDISLDTEASSSSTSSDNAKPSVDLSLPSALSALTHHLTAPLAPVYSHGTILALRSSLTTILTDLFSPTWREQDPSYGSGSRSLICLPSTGLPRPLKKAAAQNGVQEKVWRTALHKKGKESYGGSDDVDKARKGRMDEWEAWCDPGSVCWRYGAWEWFDAEFDPVRSYREPVITLWRAASANADGTADSASTSITITPARPSAAIQIRAPNGQAVSITPTPSRTTSSVQITRSNPLQAPAGIALSPSAHIRAVTSGASLRSPVMLDETPSRSGRMHGRASTYPSRNPGGAEGRQGHRACSESTSSVSSDSSLTESNSGTSASSHTTQLLTPATRPGSADIFTSARPRKGEVHTDDEGSVEGEKKKIVPLTLLRKDVNKENQVGDKASLAASASPVARGRDPSPNTITASVQSTSTAVKTTPNPPSNSTVKAEPATSPIPTVTPYDGGNVTVLGGGVKLGGGGNGGASRSSSMMSQHRIPFDRARSPSISLASRALNTAVSPGEGGAGHGGGGGRKPRTRRRIMPTYLGYVGQPGVGGPVPYAFQSMGAVGSSPLGPGPGSAPSQLQPQTQAQTQTQGQGLTSAQAQAQQYSHTHGAHTNIHNQQPMVSTTVQGQVPTKLGQWTGGVGIGMPPVRQPLQRLA